MKASLKKLFRKFVALIFSSLRRIIPQWVDDPLKQIFPPSISLPVALPVNINVLPYHFSKHFITEKIIPPRRIFKLKNVYLSGGAVVFRNFRVFLPSLTWLRDLPLYRKSDFFLKQWSSSVIKLADNKKFALVYDDWSASNYYHWMIESLPRLILIKEFYPDCTLLIPSPLPEYIKVSTSLLGFTETLSLHKYEILNISQLIFPEVVYYYGTEEYSKAFKHTELPGDAQKSNFLINRHNEELIVSARQALLQHFKTPAAVKRKVFISRSKQKTRRLKNEPDVWPLLNNYGFEILYFEELNFTQQIEVMLETAIVIGVHGANMVNILFMQSPAKVIELMNIDYVNDAYYLLASTLNLPYFSLPCSMADKSVTLNADSVILNDADLIVDVAELENVITLCLQQN